MGCGQNDGVIEGCGLWFVLDALLTTATARRRGEVAKGRQDKINLSSPANKKKNLSGEDSSPDYKLPVNDRVLRSGRSWWVCRCVLSRHNSSVSFEDVTVILPAA